MVQVQYRASESFIFAFEWLKNNDSVFIIIQLVETQNKEVEGGACHFEQNKPTPGCRDKILLSIKHLVIQLFIILFTMDLRYRASEIFSFVF